MKEKSPVKCRIAYLVGLAPRAESAILGSGRGGLDTLEQHLPGIFVCGVEEPSQGWVLCRIELPQFEGPLLAWRTRRISMTWTTLTSLRFLLSSFLM